MKHAFQLNKCALVIVIAILVACSVVFLSAPAKGQTVVKKKKEEVNSEIIVLMATVNIKRAELKGVNEKAAIWKIDVDKHNKEQAEHARLTNEHSAKVIDKTNENERIAYNARIDELEVWADSINARKGRLTARKEALNVQNMTISFAIVDATERINKLISIFQPRCEGARTLEEVVNCWSVYFDGAEIKNSMTVVVPPFKMTPNENLDHHYTKDIKPIIKRISNESLNIKVPPPAAPPNTSYFQQAEKFIQNYLEFIRNTERDKYYYRISRPVGQTVRG